MTNATGVKTVVKDRTLELSSVTIKDEKEVSTFNGEALPVIKSGTRAKVTVPKEILKIKVGKKVLNSVLLNQLLARYKL